MFLRVFILLIALSAAGGATWLMMAANQREAVVVDAEPAPIPKTDVLVATAAVTAGEVLTTDKMRWETLPETDVNEQYIVRSERPDALDELHGSFVNRAFAAGEPIRSERLMATNQNLMSNKIAPGKRAASVKVTAENTAGGFILPGDRVDVIHTITTVDGQGQPARNESRIIITNVRVLAIDQIAVQTPEGSAVGKTATLELSPEEVERIMAAEASGLLSLALRAVSDHDEDLTLPSDEIRTVRIHRGNETSTVTLR